jgi:hypothetical protein
MASYCTVSDVQKIVPKNVNIGTNVLRGEVNVTTDQVEFWIEETAGIIDSYISTIYRVPLVKYKEPNYEVNPVTFEETYPHPIKMINARLTSANIYDRIIMANQEPNVSEWGKNIRSIAYDDLKLIQNGVIQLKGQTCTGRRFARQELHDPPRAPMHSDMQNPQRAPGQ